MDSFMCLPAMTLSRLQCFNTSEFSGQCPRNGSAGLLGSSGALGLGSLHVLGWLLSIHLAGVDHEKSFYFRDYDLF